MSTQHDTKHITTLSLAPAGATQNKSSITMAGSSSIVSVKPRVYGQYVVLTKTLCAQALNLLDPRIEVIISERIPTR